MEMPADLDAFRFQMLAYEISAEEIRIFRKNNGSHAPSTWCRHGAHRQTDTHHIAALREKVFRQSETRHSSPIMY